MKIFIELRFEKVFSYYPGLYWEGQLRVIPSMVKLSLFFLNTNKKAGLTTIETANR